MKGQLRGPLIELTQAIQELNACSDDPADSPDQIFKLTTTVEQRLGHVCSAVERNSGVCKGEGWYGEEERLNFELDVCHHVMKMNQDCRIGYTIDDFTDKMDFKYAMLLKANQISYQYTKERPVPVRPDIEYLAELDEAIHSLEAVIGGLRGKYMDIFQRMHKDIYTQRMFDRGEEL